MYEFAENPIPLFEKDAKTNLTRRSVKNREIIRELYVSVEQITARELCELLILRGVAYPDQRKTAKDIETYVKEVLDEMEKHRIVLEQQVPAKKTGMKHVYSLSLLGRMVYSLLLLGDAEGASNRRAEDVKQYLLHVCKKGNPLRDFPHDVMLELISQGHSEAVARYFTPVAWIACENPALLFDAPFVKALEARAAPAFFPEDQQAYARAFLKVLRSMPAMQKSFIERSVKVAREQAYLTREPDEAYVKAVARGGPNVHVPIWCDGCQETIIIERTVEEIYNRIANGAREKCSTCGRDAVEPHVEYRLRNGLLNETDLA